MSRLKNKKIFIIVIAGFIFGIGGCLEREYWPPVESVSHPDYPFGLYKMHLTLIDSETKEPLLDLQVQLSKDSFSQKGESDAAKQVTDANGLVHITIAASPPVPQEFVLSIADKTESRLFQQETITVLFKDPVFMYAPKEAAIWGKLYQGTAEQTFTYELKQLLYE